MAESQGIKSAYYMEKNHWEKHPGSVIVATEVHPNASYQADPDYVLS
jgi:predicted DNA-binding protein (MmcQ/YjbR family)